jgi:hypothetical protein
MTAALSSPLRTKAINSNHPGMEYGVVVFDPAHAQQTSDELHELLALDGWSKVEPVARVLGEVQTFLVSRRK